MRNRPIRGPAGLLLAIMVAAISGCDFVNVTGAYRGPSPERIGLSAEEVIVRRIESNGERLIVDRVRYTSDPYNVNRVVSVSPATLKSQIDALNLRAGDHLVISTEFVQIGEIVDLPEIPNWPGHSYVEFPIGLHKLTAAARSAP